MKKTILFLCISTIFSYGEFNYLTGDIYKEKKNRIYLKKYDYYVKLTDKEKRIYSIYKDFFFRADKSLKKCKTTMDKNIKEIEFKKNIKLQKTSNYHYYLSNNIYDINITCEIPEYLSNYKRKKNKDSNSNLIIRMKDKDLYIKDNKYKRMKRFSDNNFNVLFPKEYSGAFGIRFLDIVETNNTNPNPYIRSMNKITPNQKIDFFNKYYVQPRHSDNKVYRILAQRYDREYKSSEVCNKDIEKLSNIIKKKTNKSPIKYGTKTVFNLKAKRIVLGCFMKNITSENYQDRYFLQISFTDENILTEKNVVEKNKENLKYKRIQHPARDKKWNLL